MRMSNETTLEDLRKRNDLTGRYFTGPAVLPVTFVLDGKEVRGIPEEWEPTASRQRLDSCLTRLVYEGSDDGSGLNVRVECTEYHDYPVTEWVTWFTNRGKIPTPVISDILAMNGTLQGSSPVLHHCNGDFRSADGYTPFETPLSTGDSPVFAPNGGRPCDGAFPYFRIQFEGYGLTIAVGWPGQWSAQFEALSDGVIVRAGQEKTNLRLNPGESIRTPRMTVLFWMGEKTRAVNLWRRWYLAHILPKPDGRSLKPLLACSGTDDGSEYTEATEENQIRYIKKTARHGLGFDVWWIDAGWYPCYNDTGGRTWSITGTWKPDPDRFPHGLKPVSDRARECGADLLLWFEPERVRSGTSLETEHPDWLLSVKGIDDDQLTEKERQNRLLNLGNPQCRQWLTDHFCTLIENNGIGIYRQDFNFEPLRYWRSNDSVERQGLCENFHVQGYLRFWDDLLARNTGLWIDSCASGGRRNDLETMRRSVPLHYSDHGYGDHHVKLAFHRTLYEWLPYFKDCTLSWIAGRRERYDRRVDWFSYHCGMAPMLHASLDIRRDDYDYDLARRLILIWRRASRYLLHGDYYPLTPFHRSESEWVVRQFDQPEVNSGFIQGIRLPKARKNSVTVRPGGIESHSIYLFANADTGETRTLPGVEILRDGFTFTLPRRCGTIWFYQREIGIRAGDQVDPTDTGRAT